LSTILKALRRLEEEKAATEEPRPLREQIARAPSTVRSRSTGWIAAAIALVLGIGTGGGVIWWLFGGERANTSAVASAPVVPAPSAPAPLSPVPPVPAPAAPAQPIVPGPPNEAFASDVEIVERPDALPRLADSEPVQPGPVSPALGAQRPVESSSAAERARQAALAEYRAAERARRGLPPEVVPPSPPQPAEPSIAAAPPVPTPVPVAQEPPPEPMAAPVAKPAAPPVPDRPPVVAAAKPAAAKPPAPRAAVQEASRPPPPPSIAVSVEKTQWHPLADRRIAWLRVPGETDSQRVVEGDIVDGLIVSAIEPSGVVFERNGEKIRRVLGK
jgi:hypothetical protein